MYVPELNKGNGATRSGSGEGLNSIAGESIATTGISLQPIADIRTQITDQCALHAQPEEDFRVDLLVAEGDKIAQGAPVLRSRRHPELVLTAPAAGEVAAIDLGPGRCLSHIQFFHLPEAGRHAHSVATMADDTSTTRALLLSAGMWPRLRSRPFGRMPAPEETPTAIFVMAVDTRPDAPLPRKALEGREEDFSRGLRSLLCLTEGPIFVCLDKDAVPPRSANARIRTARISPVHPHGLPGFQILQRYPARIGRIVWDIHAEDVADMGELLATGLVPETRLVSVSGPALRESRLVRCQPGADLRALIFDIVKPGTYQLLSGSALDGTPGRWLGRWHRQVTAVTGAARGAYPHWFSAALRRAGRPLPIIPTAALDQAFGGFLPAAPLVRALAANDAETAARLGVLSFVEEDVALADYVTGSSPKLASMLRAMLSRIAVEAV